MDPRVRSITPVLPVLQVQASLDWYAEVLGATEPWTWGDPIDTGGCMVGAASLMFGFDPDLAGAVRGLRYRLNVFDVRGFWDRVQHHDVRVLEGFGPRPWGSHEFRIEDLNGFELVFGEFGATRNQSPHPAITTLEERPLTAAEALDLFISIGWAKPGDSLEAPPSYPYTVVALFDGRVVGAASLAGDGNHANVVRDVMVHADFQGMGIGSRLMEALEAHLRALPGRPYVFLSTGPGLIPFYERFGFSTSDGPIVSMCRHF